MVAWRSVRLLWLALVSAEALMCNRRFDERPRSEAEPVFSTFFRQDENATMFEQDHR